MSNYTEQILWKACTGILGVLSLILSFFAVFKGVWIIAGVSLAAGILSFYVCILAFIQNSNFELEKNKYETAVDAQKRRKTMKVIK